MVEVTAKAEITREQVTIGPGSPWRRLPLVGAVLAVVGLGATAALAGGQARQLYFSYLVAFLFFLSLALGGLFFVLVQHASRSGWSVVVRRIAEDVMGTLPIFIVLFIPVAVGVHSLFHWSHADAVQSDALLRGKAPYLNTTFFYIRAAVFLATWSGLAWWYRRLSVRQDESGDPQLTRRLQVASGPAIVAYGVTQTFASFDWAMSLDPHWYSTMYGVYFFAGSAVGIYALLGLLVAALDRSGLLGDAVTTEHFHDIGKMIFAFVCFWAYIAFSQYLLQWYANIPEETVWYLERWKGAWKQASVLLAVGHFPIPFFFLLPRTIKRSTRAVVLAAVWVLVMHYLDLYWLVMPSLHPHWAHLSPLDLTTFVGVGGVFLAALGWLLRRGALVPIRDPRLAESLRFENNL